MPKRQSKPARVPAKRAAPSTPAAQQQPELRALTVFDALPAGHRTFHVNKDGCEPHLRRGE
jgi:hypothetical protein